MSSSIGNIRSPYICAHTTFLDVSVSMFLFTSHNICLEVILVRSHSFGLLYLKKPEAGWKFFFFLQIYSVVATF